MRNKFRDLVGRNHPGVRGVLQPPTPTLTWTCHVCGEERPDRLISVFTRERMWPGGVRFRENVRYCNDRMTCQDGASEVYFVDRDMGDQDFGRVQVRHDGS